MPRKTNFTTTDANGNVNQYFRVTATIGKKADGSPLRKQFYGESKKAAEAKRDEYLAGLKQGLSIDYQKNTFGKAFEHWLNHVHMNTVSHSTYTKYERFFRLYIANSGVAAMRLIDLKSVNIQAHYNALDTTPHNIFELHRILRTFFRYCVKADILMKSPLLAVEVPKIPQKSTPVNEALKDADIQKLIKATKHDIVNFPYLFLAFTGLRVGELMALMYKDIDFHEGVINVNKALKFEPHPVVSDTKTPASIRRVPVLDEIKPLLLEHIQAIKQKNKNIIRLDGNFILFPSEEGTYRRKASLLEVFKDLCNQLDIRQGRTLHSLRHTFCTILARQGVSLLDASRLMGHSNVNVTARIYSHVTDNDKKNAVRKLAAYFN